MYGGLGKMISTESIDIEKIDKIMKVLVNECLSPNHNKDTCDLCRAHKNLKDFSIDSPDLLMYVILGQITLKAIFIIGFTAAIRYIQVKELEDLEKLGG